MTSQDKVIDEKDLKDLLKQSLKATKHRKKAAKELKQAQDVLNGHSAQEKSETRIKNETVFVDGINLHMIWTHVPDYAGSDGLMPDREPCPPLYCKLKFLLMVNYMKTDHDEIYSLCYRIRASLTSEYRDLRAWFQTILNSIVF